MTAKTGALIWAFAFIAVGALGFIDNPIIGASKTAMFHTDTVHNWVHIISGILFLLVALAAPGSARGFLILFGIVYLAVGVLALSSLEQMEWVNCWVFFMLMVPITICILALVLLLHLQACLPADIQIINQA